MPQRNIGEQRIARGNSQGHEIFREVKQRNAQ